MAGQGDVNNPNAWTDDAPTLGVGSLATPPPQGGIILDAPSPNDPDFYFGSFTLLAAVATLGVATVTAATGMGQPESPETWAAVAPTLGVGSLAPPPAQGEIMDPDAWGSVAPSLGVGALASVQGLGDVGDVYAPNEIFAGVLETWAQGTVTLGVGAITVPTGQGDVMDPFAWQDAVLYLTSNLYPLEQVDHLTGAAQALNSPQPQTIEHIRSIAFLLGGTLSSNLVVYANWPVEHVSGAGSFGGGTLTLGLLTYTNWPAEHVQNAASFAGGTLTQGLINYPNWPTEHVTMTGLFSGGTLV